MVQSADFVVLSDQFDRIINKMAAVEKTPRDFGSGDLLYRSEVHTLKAIGENAGANITALARYAGTSKSAVSQMVDRLVRRDLVEKYRNPENDKDILLRLTHRGRIAFLGHEQYHLKIHARVEQRLKEMTTEEFRSLQEIFRTIEETVDESLADRG